jgi:hypothetical protein
LLGQLGVKAAVTVKDTVQKKIEIERKKQSPQNSPTSPSDVKNVHHIERVMHKADKLELEKKTSSTKSVQKNVRSEHYVSDDETLSYDDR